VGCHKFIAQAILDQGTDYILAVKDNQATLRQKIEEVFDDAERVDYAYASYDTNRQAEKGHGRIETRRCWVIDDQDYLLYIQGVCEKEQWPGLSSIVKLASTRRMGDKTSNETRYYIFSLSCSAKQMQVDARSHWGIENGLHWVLDTSPSAKTRADFAKAMALSPLTSCDAWPSIC